MGIRWLSLLRWKGDWRKIADCIDCADSADDGNQLAYKLLLKYIDQRPDTLNRSFQRLILVIHGKTPNLNADICQCHGII